MDRGSSDTGAAARIASTAWYALFTEIQSRRPSSMASRLRRSNHSSSEQAWPMGRQHSFFSTDSTKMRVRSSSSRRRRAEPRTLRALDRSCTKAVIPPPTMTPMSAMIAGLTDSSTPSEHCEPDSTDRQESDHWIWARRCRMPQPLPPTRRPRGDRGSTIPKVPRTFARREASWALASPISAILPSIRIGGAVRERFDDGGSSVPARGGTATGRRIHVERIPDQPYSASSPT